MLRSIRLEGARIKAEKPLEDPDTIQLEPPAYTIAGKLNISPKREIRVKSCLFTNDLNYIIREEALPQKIRRLLQDMQRS